MSLGTSQKGGCPHISDKADSSGGQSSFQMNPFAKKAITSNTNISTKEPKLERRIGEISGHIYDSTAKH